MTTFLKNDKGDDSWLRLALTIVIFAILIFCGLVYFDWRSALRIEMVKEAPNYDGINTLFQSMMIGFIGSVAGAFLIKVIQKFIETWKK